jgi:uncharacterized membrane protein
VTDRLLTMAALAMLVAGLVAWMWTGDWRWAVTGAGAMVILAAGVRPRKRAAP